MGNHEVTVPTMKALDALRAELRAEFQDELRRLREELRTAGGGPMCIRVAQACDRFGFARSTFDRWLADSRVGLDAGPEPVVIRPNGPGGKVLVHVARMQAWLDARGGPARRTSPRAR